MAIELIVEPERYPMKWANFKKRKPYSVALDGYVSGGPKYNPDGPHHNFNHHEGVDRFATRATCGQVLLAVRMNVMDAYRTENGVCMNVYVNDCDQDVCLSWYILKHYFMSEDVDHVRLNQIVAWEDMMDTCAGAYPHKVNDLMSQMFWVFEPHDKAKLDGTLDNKNPAEYKAIIADVETRIMNFLMGNCGNVELDTKYEELGGGYNWKMVKEIGNAARTGLFSDGIRAFVSARKRQNGNYTYSIGRMSPFIQFPVVDIIEHLNNIEGCNEKDRWGGAVTIGGSPRVGGSNIPPEDLERIINEYLETLVTTKFVKQETPAHN